ncbi:MAG: ABC transporter ATP-binding protein [Oligoflexales bacterium]|nr:ABC transporter ATP-binding protein [Oligoflexales bacterium]
MEVEFINVTKQYGSVTAVSNLNLHIQKGSLHFLLGPSGCGKTTTLRMLAGLEKVSKGKILFDGKDVTDEASSDRGIGMVFQNYALWPHMTVRQNIEYPLKLRKLSPTELRSRISEALAFTQLSHLQGRLPSQLSGGQQQRVALARALAIRPNVVLLDEPLSNLDAKLRLEMRDNISRIHRETGITTFYVTHDQKEALSMGTQITVMHEGVKIQTGSPKALYLTPNSSFLAAFIGETNIITGTYVEESSGIHKVDTVLGLLQTHRITGSFRKGDKVDLSIRPEAIQVENEGGQSLSHHHNTVKLKISRVTYLGEMEQLNLTYSGDKTLKANLYHVGDHDFLEGQEIHCFIDPQHMVVLPRDPSMSAKSI